MVSGGSCCQLSFASALPLGLFFGEAVLPTTKQAAEPVFPDGRKGFMLKVNLRKRKKRKNNDSSKNQHDAANTISKFAVNLQTVVRWRLPQL